MKGQGFYSSSLFFNFESHKENWKIVTFAHPGEALPLNLIKRIERKNFLLLSHQQYEKESHKENWKFKLWNGKNVFYNIIKESHKENWKMLWADTESVFSNPIESHKENWKQTLHSTWQAEESIESHKENWKLKSSALTECTSKSRIS